MRKYTTILAVQSESSFRCIRTLFRAICGTLPPANRYHKSHYSRLWLMENGWWFHIRCNSETIDFPRLQWPMKDRGNPGRDGIRASTKLYDTFATNTNWNPWRHMIWHVWHVSTLHRINKYLNDCSDYYEGKNTPVSRMHVRMLKSEIGAWVRTST